MSSALRQAPRLIWVGKVPETNVLTLVLFSQGSEQVTDPMEWLQQLTDSAQIVSPEAMQYILMEWVDKQEELDGAAAEAAAGGDTDAEAEADMDAEAEADMDAEAEAGAEAEAEAEADAEAAAAAAAGMQAESMSHDGPNKRSGSQMPAAAGVSRQSKSERCCRT